MSPVTIHKHAVLFGGAGFIGTELATALARENWQVTVVTRYPHRHRNLQLVPSLRLVEAKKLSLATIASLVGPGDTVVNLVGILHQSRSASFSAVHVELPKQIAEICLQNKVRRLIHISALGADINSSSRYLASRGQGENALQAALRQGLDSTIIRPSIVFGPEDSFSRMFARLLSMTPGFFPLICPNSMVQPVYVKDLVTCIVHAIDTENLQHSSFDVAGPERVTLKEFVRKIDYLSGMNHRIIGLGPFVSKFAAFFAQFAPGKPLTLDNIRSLNSPNEIRANTPKPYGVQKTHFDTVAADWLSSEPSQFDRFRTEAGR